MCTVQLPVCRVMAKQVLHLRKLHRWSYKLCSYKLWPKKALSHSWLTEQYGALHVLIFQAFTSSSISIIQFLHLCLYYTCFHASPLQNIANLFSCNTKILMYFSDLLQSTVFHQLVAQCLFSLSFFLHLLVEMLFFFFFFTILLPSSQECSLLLFSRNALKGLYGERELSTFLHVKLSQNDSWIKGLFQICSLR